MLASMAQDQDKAIASFFKLFSQFEYCLKITGFFTTGRSNEAKPDWTEFAKTLKHQIVDSTDPAVQEAVKYVLENPPKKQIIQGKVLDWCEAEPNTDSKNDLILIYVRRVRNNLFHGGKFNGRFFNPDRSFDLLRHSESILLECILKSDPMLEAYECNAFTERH